MHRYPILLSFCLGFLGLLTTASAQDIQTINNLFFNPAGYNSAFIIEDESLPTRIALTSSLGGGLQNIRRMHLLAYTNIPSLEIGVGVRVNSAFYGLFNTTVAETMYAKDFSINETQRFFVGLNFGIHYTGLNNNALNDYVQARDPFLLSEDFPQYRFTAGFGVAYMVNQKFQLGFSIPSLLRTQNDLRPAFVANVANTFTLNSVLDIRPEVLVFGSQGPNLTAEFNTTLTYYDIFSVKLGARTTKSWLFGLGWTRDVLSFDYLYLLNTGKFQEINTGVHNVNVGYAF